jgi:hypothetical protein
MPTKQQSSTQHGLLSSELTLRESNSSTEERDLAAARNQLNLIGKVIQTHYESRKNLTTLNETVYFCHIEVDAFAKGHVTVQFIGLGQLQGNIKGAGTVAGAYVGNAIFLNEPPSNTTFVNVNAGTALCEANFFNGGGQLIGSLSATGPSLGAFSGGGNVVWR